MKITGFNPAILTSDFDAVISLFEDLGFFSRHKKDNIEDDGKVSGTVRLKDENGFVIDINKFEYIPRDEAMIRMNVDNFEEGYQFLLDHGFRNVMPDGGIIEAPYLKGAHMVSPFGFGIMLMQHIRKEK